MTKRKTLKQSRKVITSRLLAASRLAQEPKYHRPYAQTSNPPCLDQSQRIY